MNVVQINPVAPTLIPSLEQLPRQDDSPPIPQLETTPIPPLPTDPPPTIPPLVSAVPELTKVARVESSNNSIDQIPPLQEIVRGDGEQGVGAELNGQDDVPPVLECLQEPSGSRSDDLNNVVGGVVAKDTENLTEGVLEPPKLKLEIPPLQEIIPEPSAIPIPKLEKKLVQPAVYMLIMRDEAEDEISILKILNKKDAEEYVGTAWLPTGSTALRRLLMDELVKKIKLRSNVYSYYALGYSWGIPECTTVAQGYTSVEGLTLLSSDAKRTERTAMIRAAWLSQGMPENDQGFRKMHEISREGSGFNRVELKLLFIKVFLEEGLNLNVTSLML